MREEFQSNNPDNAQILCSWTDNKEEASFTQEEAGNTSVFRVANSIFGAKIILFTPQKEYTPKAMESPANYMALLSLHEIGHALGLEHSSRPNDIMYPNMRYFDGAPKHLSEYDKKSLTIVDR